MSSNSMSGPGPIRSAPGRKRRRPMWQRVAAWVVGSIVVLTVLLVAFIALFDWNKLKPTINERASAALERPFAINGDLSVHWGRADDLAGWRSWIPTPVIRANDISVGNPAWVGDKSDDGFAKVDQAEFAVHLLPLLGQHLSLPYVRLTGPTANLLRRDAEHATWNFGSGGEPGSWTVNLGQLRVGKAKIDINDKVSKADFAITVEPLDKEIPFSELVGDDGGNAAPSNTQAFAYAWTAKGKYGGAPIDASGKIGSVLTLRQGKRPLPLQVDAKLGDVRVRATGTLTDPTDPSGLDLRLKLSGGSMAQLFPYTGIALPDTPPFSTSGHLTARIQPDDRRYHYENFVGKVGDSDLAGTLTFTSGGDRPKLEGKLHSEQLRLADLGPLIGADTSDKKSATVDATPKDKLLPSDAFNTDRWNAMDADVTFEGKKVVQDAGLPIAGLATHIVMDSAKLTLDPLGVGLANGKLNGKVVLDARKTPMIGTVDLKARGLGLKQLFPKFESMQASFGEINGDIILTATGQSVAGLMARSDGDVMLLMNDGAISKELMELAGLNVGNFVVTKLFGDKQVNIECAAANFGVTDGLMSTRLAIFDTDNATIDISGSINFKNEQMDLSIVPKTKGLRIFSLRSPLYVRGTLANPDVGVEAGKLIAKGAAALALGAVAAPAAALIPLIAPSHEERDNRCEALLSRLQEVK
ncbi:MAG: AsmA family protein [Dokdonella sp.]